MTLNDTPLRLVTETCSHSRCEDVAGFARTVETEDGPYLVLALASAAAPMYLGEAAVNKYACSISELAASDSFKRTADDPSAWRSAVTNILRDVNTVFVSANRELHLQCLMSAAAVLLTPDRNFTVLSTGDTLCLLKGGGNVVKANAQNTVKEANEKADQPAYEADADTVINAVGLLPELRVRKTTTVLPPGTEIYLCTRGISKYLEEVVRQVMASAQPALLPGSLIRLAEEKRGPACADMVIAAYERGEADGGTV